jgi:hypothetical protein
MCMTMKRTTTRRLICAGVLFAAVGLASLTGCARGRPVAATAVPPRTVVQVKAPDGDWYRPALDDGFRFACE